MRSGELFAGVGGLGMAIDEVFGSTPAWFAEFDAAPSKVLRHHYPDVPNYGDVTTLRNPPPVNILAGGFPCQDVSLAGRRRGMKEGTRSGLWSEFARIIDTVRPDWVVIENVRGLLSADAAGFVESCPLCVGDNPEHVLRALGAVLGDLAELGFDAEWTGLRASDVGAPHGRFRVFILAWPAEHTNRRGRNQGGRPGDVPPMACGRNDPADSSAATDAGHSAGRVTLLPTPAVVMKRVDDERTQGQVVGDITDWGPYEAAIRRWETFTGRPAPAPVRHDGKGGKPRLNPELTEWMMGWPAGWVTDPAISLTRAEQLKACGNGVVPQQAAAALRNMLARPGVPQLIKEEGAHVP